VLREAIENEGLKARRSVASVIVSGRNEAECAHEIVFAESLVMMRLDAYVKKLGRLSWWRNVGDRPGMKISSEEPRASSSAGSNSAINYRNSAMSATRHA